MPLDIAGLPLADRRIPPGGDWLSPEELAALTPEILLERTRAMAPRVAAAAGEAERLRRPVDEIWNALRAAGYFYMYVPHRFGGLEVTTDEFIDITLPLAQACPSTAWAASFCAEHNWIASHFPQETQEALFGGAWPYIVAPGVSTPIGEAIPVEGGYRVTGRWKWGTGVMHADWIIAGALAQGGPSGPPKPLFCLFPAQEAVVLDTWHAAGMAGTGSNDIVAEGIFVPEASTVSLSALASGRAPGSRGYDNPIYRMPMLPFLALTAAMSALGAARLALAAHRERLAGHTRWGAVTAQAEKPAAQIRLGKADVMIAAAEQVVRQAGRDNLASGALEGEAQMAARLANRARIAYAVQLCREAVALLAEAAGSSAQMLDQPFQRAQRDLAVISTHVVFDVDTAYELSGRALLGMPPNSTLV
jgi:alkylation response protein AidB-like acyl-CoA dehydrogenase